MARLYLRLLLAFAALLVFCEYMIYYLVLIRCQWPQLDAPPERQLRAMVLADTHLLGPKRGHWYDKLRREWQMHRAFQTAMTLFAPEAVFVLGDLFDEGLWSNQAEFQDYVSRFNRLFAMPTGTVRHVAVGNHDVGFHYYVTPYLNSRFKDLLDAPDVKLVTLKGSHFVLVNSMAMEGDGCSMCKAAEAKVKVIGKALDCIKSGKVCENDTYKLDSYSRPVIFQHFPMYRDSDMNCSEPDQAPEDEKSLAFNPKWDCLSKDSSDMLISTLDPRIIMTGHTHHGCFLKHPRQLEEWTLPSFNWRNKDNPSFALLTISPDKHAVEKCYMPRESTVIRVYLVATFAIIMYAIVSQRWISAKLFRNRYVSVKAR